MGPGISHIMRHTCEKTDTKKNKLIGMVKQPPHTNFAAAAAKEFSTAVAAASPAAFAAVGEA